MLLLLFAVVTFAISQARDLTSNGATNHVNGVNGVNLEVFSNLGLAGTPLFKSIVANVGNIQEVTVTNKPPLSYRWTTTLTPPITTTTTSYRFSIHTQSTTGFVRLWVDDHILLDRNVVAQTQTPTNYSVPIPFFASRTSAKIQVEFIPSSSTTSSSTSTSSSSSTSFFSLFANNIAIDTTQLCTHWPKAETIYTSQRNLHERGWNTWYDFDLFTHALLPHGLALSLSFSSLESNASFANLGTPSCDRQDFPATHGLHAQRGEYTEIETFDFDGEQYKIESATDPSNINVNVIVVTRLPSSSWSSDSQTNTMVVSLNASVPRIWAPLACDIHSNTPFVSAKCPGLDTIVVESVVDHGTHNASLGPTTTTTGLNVKFSLSSLPAIAFVARTTTSTAAPVSINYTLSQIQDIVAHRRLELTHKFTTMANTATQKNNATGGTGMVVQNETAAGLVTSIAWNVIYTVQEGIIAPVFRGSVWGLDRGSGYVLFEWDSFFAAWIATKVDPWLAKNQLIRMAKSMVNDPVHGGGLVIGFWNGHCGEMDKSKPPIGGLLLQDLFKHQQKGMGIDWVGEVVLDQLAAWSEWWVEVRFMGNGNGTNHEGTTTAHNTQLYAPGSTRQLMNYTLMCVHQNPVSASRCETGLDNSPLYDAAVFNNATNTIDQTDVGMSALIMADALALSYVATKLGRTTLALALNARAEQIQTTLQSVSWDEASNLYMNRNWVTNDYVVPKTAAPTSFYPMLASISSDQQVEQMMARWLTNVSEFCVHPNCVYGVPSIARSNPAFHDNDYWRGRSWGPMNFLVYLGLQQYAHLESVRQAKVSLMKQSQAVFLKEWVGNRRVMENYNSNTGEGCDVGNANPFYHWGALMALIPFR